MKFSDLTQDQQQRVAYGAAHEIIRQTLDNGDLVTVDFAEFLPRGFYHDSSEEELEFVNQLQTAIETVVMSPMFEEAAKHDV